MIQISKPFLTDKEIDAAVEVLKSGNLSQGPKVKEFEENFAKFCGAKYAIAVNNGTAALHCILFALGIKSGDEVITTPFTFVASANSIIMAGAKPIFADISEEDFNIDPKSIETRITDKTKGIMPVNLYGQIYNVEAITEIARKHNLKIVEDACQSIAAEYQGKKSGLFGDAAAFSLYATKNITAGIGGMITTNDEEVMRLCKLYRHHGQDENTQYDYIIFGYNYRMMDAIAVIGNEQLKRVDELTEAREKNARRLMESLAGIPGIVLPEVKEGYKHVWHQFTLRITSKYKMSRDEFIEKLKEKDIQCKIYYPKPLHLYPQFYEYGYKAGDCPVAERLALEVVSLPVHPLVTEEEMDHIIETIKNL